MPLWISNSMNGLATGQYNGSSSTLATSLTTSQTSSTFSVFNTAAASGPVWTYTDAIDFTGFFPHYTNGRQYLSVDTLGDWPLSPASTFSIGTSYLSSAIYGTNYSGLYQNGALNGSIAENTNATGYLRIGERFTKNNYFNGTIGEIIYYNSTLSSNAQALVNQYQSAKWGIGLTGPGVIGGEAGLTGTEAQQAMASTQAGATSDGYSVFTTGYLGRLSQSSNIILQAGNNVNLDLQGDSLSLASGKSLTLTAGNQITTASSGTIATNNGDINLNAANGIVLNNALTFNQ